MKNVVLYNAPQSTCSQRVRYALNAKGIGFEEHKLDLFSGDQLRPEYIAINPNAVVPSLIHDGAIILDSAVILEYLEDMVPDVAPMRPRDPQPVARMRFMMRFIDEVPTPAVRVPSYNLAFLPHFQAMTEAEFQAVCDAKPLRRDFLRRMGRTGFPQEDMDNATARLRQGVERLAGWIEDSGGPWAMGADLTLADIAIMPVIVRMDDIAMGHLWDDRPAVQAWLDRLRETAPFAPTYCHGALLSEKYPHLAQSLHKGKTGGMQG